MDTYDPNSVERKRSDKDTVPEFKSGEDALEFMEKKLNGSWVDDILEDPKSKGVVGGHNDRTTGIVTPNTGTVTHNPTDVAGTGANATNRQNQVRNVEPSTPPNEPVARTGYSPDMTGAELAAYLEKLWNKPDASE